VGYLIHQTEGFFDVGVAERRLMVWQPRFGETERA
jgi:hypothetical protein